jgi:rubrerythrin
MSAPGGRAVTLDPDRPGTGTVICDKCGYHVAVLETAWRCWHCGSRWPWAAREPKYVRR